MERKQDALIRTNLSRAIKSFSAGKDDLHNLFQILQERNYSARDIEVANFQRMNQDEEAYEQNKKLIIESFDLRLTVNGADGKQLYGSLAEIFNSPNFPAKVQSIFVSSATLFEVTWNFPPRNRFELLLDFTKPQVLDLSFLPSQATPNASNVAVSGYDSTWVHGVFNELNTFIDNHPSQIKWIHKHSMYDLLLFILGLPLAFWAVWKLSTNLNRAFGSVSVVVQSAAYVYVFFISLFVFRVLFHYARWVWPLVEYRSPNNKTLKHRLVLGAVSLGIISSVIYDIIKFII